MYLLNIRRKHVAGGTITRKSVATAVVTLPKNSYAYTGEAISPTVTVRLDGSLLSVNEDYTVSYVNNTNVGLATIVITGIGDFYGTAIKEFYITAAPSGWQFKVEDMEHVGSVRSVAWQGANMLAVSEDYSNSDALLVGYAFLNNLFIFGQRITKDSQGNVHIANMVLSSETSSNGSNPYLHARWVSGDGKKTYWWSNSDSKICVPATCSTGYDFANLSFDTASTFDKSVFTNGSSPFVFSFDGLRVFSFGDSSSYRRVYYADLSTAFDLGSMNASSASYVDLTDIPASYTKVVSGIVFSSNGRNMLVTAGTNVYQFVLENAFNLSDVTLTSSKEIDVNLRGIALVNKSTTLIGMTDGGYVHEYNLVA